MASEDPISQSMAGRYANALFELAREQGRLPQVESDIRMFEAMLADSEDLRRLVKSPVFSADDQGRAIGAVLAKSEVSLLTANFFRLIARNRRLFAAPDMIKAFRTILARHRGEVTAEVASAMPLNDTQLAALKAQLKASTGKDVQINTSVDPALLGGLVVKVGSRMIDSSLRTKLNNLKVNMKGVG